MARATQPPPPKATTARASLPSATRVPSDTLPLARPLNPYERERVQDLAIADLTPLRRYGFRGDDAAAWLVGLGFSAPPDRSHAVRHPDGHVVVLVGDRQFLVLPPLDPVARGFWQTVTPPDANTRCWATPPRDGSLWFRVTGRRAPQVMTEIASTATQTSVLEDLQVMPVTVMRHAGLLVRDDLVGVVGYHILLIRASASFLWTCVSNLIADVGGVAINPDSLTALTTDRT